jgi:hypothetical protein
MKKLFPNNGKDLMVNLINNHILFFSFLVVIIHVISSYLQKYSIQIFQLCLFSSMFSYLNGDLTTYQFLFGGIISTLSGYIIYKLLNKYLPNTVIIAFICFITTTVMIVTNTMNIATLSYALGAPTLIPQIQNKYLISFVLATIIVIAFYRIYAEIFNKYLQPYLVKNYNKNITPIKTKSKIV